jgi:hypothetical protein
MDEYALVDHRDLALNDAEPAVRVLRLRVDSRELLLQGLLQGAQQRCTHDVRVDRRGR